MRCPKCGYNSFEFNQACPKCGRDLTSTREHLGFFPFVPQLVPYLDSLLSEAGHDFVFEVEEAEAVDLGTYAEEHEVETGGLPSEEGPSVSLEPEEDQGISFTPEAEVGLSFEEESMRPESGVPQEEEIGLTLETEEEPGISLEPGPAESESLEVSNETVIIEPEEIPQVEERPSGLIEPDAPVQLAGEEELGLDLEIADQEETVEGGPGEPVIEFEDLNMAEAEEGVEIGGEAIQDYSGLPDAQAAIETPSEEMPAEGALGVEETVMLEPEEIPGLEDIGAASGPEEEVSLAFDEGALTEEKTDLDSGGEEGFLEAESTLIIEPEEEAEDQTQIDVRPPVVESGLIEPLTEKSPDQEADLEFDLIDLDFEEEPQSASPGPDSPNQESLDLDLDDLELIIEEEEGGRKEE